MTESDLFPPIKAHFEDLGYRIQAEVKDCDVVAISDEEIIIIELKQSANMKLLIQATERQAITPLVYVAIPAPSRRSGRHFRGIKRVLKRLGLGLLLVQASPLGDVVRAEIEPADMKVRSNSRRKKSVVKEARSRSANYNIGGASRAPIMTAYKETAIFIACCLVEKGPLSPKELRRLGSGEKTLSILSNNHYAWFERVSRGVYQVTEKGAREARANPAQVARSLKLIKSAT